MTILIAGRWPPIQGGTTVEMICAARRLRTTGVEFQVVTDSDGAGANEVHLFGSEDAGYLANSILSSHDAILQAATALKPLSDRIALTARVSAIAGALITAGHERQPSAIAASYFEPYGVAAWIAAKELGCPLLLRHAGSDIEQLAAVPALGETYGAMIRDAHAIATSARAVRALSNVSGSSSISTVPLARARTPFWFDEGQSVKRPRFDSDETHGWIENVAGSECEVRQLLTRSATTADELWDSGAPIILCYGKIGRAKGTASFVDAARIIMSSYIDVRFVLVTSGPARALRALARKVEADPDLSDRFLVLPFISPWRIPDLIHSAAVVCFLESQFPVLSHAPRPPEEIMKAGGVLLCCRDMVERHPLSKSISHDRTAMISQSGSANEVASLLSRCLRSPELRAETSSRARALMNTVDQIRQYESPLADFMTEVLG